MTPHSVRAAAYWMLRDLCRLLGWDCVLSSMVVRFCEDDGGTTAEHGRAGHTMKLRIVTASRSDTDECAVVPMQCVRLASERNQN